MEERERNKEEKEKEKKKKIKKNIKRKGLTIPELRVLRVFPELIDGPTDTSVTYSLLLLLLLQTFHATSPT